jgi:hypothetical protein
MTRIKKNNKIIKSKDYKKDLENYYSTQVDVNRLNWAGYYDRYVIDILKDIKDGKDKDAVNKIYTMIKKLKNNN